MSGANHHIDPSNNPLNVPMKSEGEAPGFFDKPGTRRMIWIALIVLCAGFAIAGLLIDTHGYFHVEDIGVFYGVFGFVVFSFIVLVGQHLRRILMRPEDYYDE